MKKFAMAVFAIVCACTVYAQEKDVTRFLGIPVDGSKSEMIQKLQDKGFKSSSYDKDILEGEFNGVNVNLHIATNNNKVWRIMVSESHLRDESDIKNRFNRLCSQFSNNPNYTSMQDYTISEEEDISYEMIVHKKQYAATFYQKPNIDSIEMAKIIMEDFIPKLKEKFTQEQISASTNDVQHELLTMTMSYVVNVMENKSVSLRIFDFRGEYFISLFYDNKYNQANGEDL